MDISETRCLELQFSKQLAGRVLTGLEIKGEGHTALEVALVNPLTNQVVNSGPLASTEIEIVALNGDFGDVQGGNWTSEQFNENIVTEREDIPVENEEFPKTKRKRPLLGGKTLLNLNKGKCYVKNIKFKHSSLWMKLSKFRLGARIPSTHSGIQVKEALSDQFTVEDRRNDLRNKSSGKHYPPSIDDEVWRLKNIGRNGPFHKRLSNANVNSVKDFLILLHRDPTTLRNILGKTMPTKKWDATVSHAQTCELDKKLYLYHSSESQQKKAVVFNVVGQVIWFFFNNQHFSDENLSASDKAHALDLVETGFQNWKKVKSFDDEASLIYALSCFFAIDYSPNPLVVADFDGNNSPIANAYGNGDNPDLSFNVDYTSNPLVAANSYGYNTLTPNPYGNGDYPELSSFDDYFSGIDQVLSNCESFIPQISVEDKYPQNYNPSNHLQTEQQNAVSVVLEDPVLSDRGHRRWKMLFSAMRWISLKRISAIKSCFANKRQIIQ
ncbi:calmodulin-binding protein 60 A-like [Coffea eugenioides]|uniref:Calmodulin-binding protein 60 A n=1 Tax=Coffea arabica TaxID=13443 RepID=A0A6P6XCW2_COFAR|nr:calmodulin-binding protein 60 A-like [Coffea arabica]XP_027169002.1 calmodulin-binding protein 60 A-like [Coffea eugenioides]